MIYLLTITLVYFLWKFFKKSSRNYIFIDPISSLLLFAFLLFILPCLLNPSIKINFVSIFGLIVVILSGLLISDKTHFVNRININDKSVKKIINFFGISFWIIMFINFLLVLMTVGINEIYTRDRLSEYLNQEVLTSGGVFSSFALICEPFFFLFLSLLHKKKKSLFLFYFTTFLFFLSVTSNTRLALILPLLAYFLYMLHKNKKSSKYALSRSILGVILLIFYLYMSNIVRSGLELKLDNNSEIIVNTLAKEINYNRYIDDATNYIKENDYENGYGWYLGSIANIIPRSVWPDKPVTSLSNRFTEKISGKPISLYNPVMTFTIIGEGYLQLGLLGVFLEVFFYIFCFKFFFFNFLNNNRFESKLLAFHILTVFLIYFRAEIPFVHIFIYFFIYFLINDKKRQNSLDY